MTREEAIKKVKGYLTDCLPDDCYGEVEEIIKALEEPIKCGECKHWDEYVGWCRMHNEYIFNDDYFCNKAERRK